jgi:hypothetical protein
MIYHNPELNSSITSVRFEVLTQVTAKMADFRDDISCSLVEGYQCFRGTCSPQNIGNPLPGYTALYSRSL